MKQQDFIKEVEECEEGLDYLDPRARSKELRKLKELARRYNNRATRKMHKVSYENIDTDDRQ